MSARHRLQSLLEHPRIWRAGSSHHQYRAVLGTGFKALDRALAGGWPSSTLNELLVDAWGIGEFRLLMPAISALTRSAGAQRGRWAMLVNPPYLPYAPALAGAGVELPRLLVTRCKQPADVFWAMEQALHSGQCGVVVRWCGSAGLAALRRLQLAAEASSCWAVLFRPARFRHQRSPAALRMYLRAEGNQRISLDIFKYRGGRPQRLSLHA